MLLQYIKIEQTTIDGDLTNCKLYIHPLCLPPNRLTRHVYGHVTRIPYLRKQTSLNCVPRKYP